MTFNPIQNYEYGKNRGSIPDGLIHYYRFNNDLVDQIGGNNASGLVVYVPGVSGQAIDVEAGEPAVLGSQVVGGEDNFSISCLFRVHSLGSNVIYGSWTTPTTSMLLWLNGSDLLVFFNTGSSSSFTFFTGFSDINIWKHLVFTYDGVLGKMYLDGVKAASDWSKTGVLNTGTQLEGWGRGGTSSNNFTGDIDGAGLWNKALSQQEVTDIYTKQLINGEELV